MDDTSTVAALFGAEGQPLFSAGACLAEIVVSEDIRQSLEKALQANCSRGKRELEELANSQNKRQKHSQSQISQISLLSQSKSDADDSDSADKSPKGSLVSTNITVPLRCCDRPRRKVVEVPQTEDFGWSDAPKRRGRLPAKSVSNPQNPPSVVSSACKRGKRAGSLFSNGSSAVKSRKVDDPREWRGVRLLVEVDQIVNRNAAWQQQCHAILEAFGDANVVFEVSARGKERLVPGNFFFQPPDGTKYKRINALVGSTKTDLRTVKQNLASGQYDHPTEFSADVGAVLHAWMEFYEDDSNEYYRSASRMNRLFDHLFSKVAGANEVPDRPASEPTRRRPGRPPGRPRDDHPLSSTEREDFVKMHNTLPLDMQQEVADWFPSEDFNKCSDYDQNDGKVTFMINRLAPRKQRDLLRKVQKMTKDAKNRKKETERRRRSSFASGYKPAYDRESTSSEEEPTPMFPFRRNTPLISRTPRRPQMEQWTFEQSAPAFPTAVPSCDPYGASYSAPFGSSQPFSTNSFGSLPVCSNLGSATQTNASSNIAQEEFTMMDQVDDVLAVLDPGGDHSANTDVSTSGFQNPTQPCAMSWNAEGPFTPTPSEHLWGEPVE